jgi:hypothetical protein
MNLKTLMKDIITILENTSINDDSNITNWILNSNSDTGINSNEHYDGKPCQFEQIDDENEFKDIKLENLMMAEGPQQILQLIL